MLKQILLLFVISYMSFCQTVNSYDSLISLWKKSSGSEVERLEDKLIVKMYTLSYDSAKALSDKLLAETAGLKNNSLYIKALTHSYRFYPFTSKIKLLNKAEALAENEQFLLSGVYMFKAIAFRDNSMTDSAMIYALKSKDILEGSVPESELAGILQIIADLHYYAGDYEEAEAIYRRILTELKIDPGHWRINTLNNNIGLIRMKQHRYAEAEIIFKQSLNRLMARKMNYADSSGLPYLYRKLLEVTLNQEKLAEAETYFSLGEKMSNKFKQLTELPGIYAAKGKLCLAQNKPDSALYYLRKAEKADSVFPDLENKVNIYSGIAKAYSLLNNDKTANEYLQRFIDAQSKVDSAYYRARYMNIFAEYNYNNYLREIREYKWRQKLYIGIISFTIIMSLVIAYFYLKVARAHKKLVQKNIEVVEGITHFERADDQESEEEEKDSSDIDDVRLEKIISQLEQIMKTNKLYLDKEISLEKVADILHTNRTYLSKAINKAFNINFKSYINDLRVKEAIHIITNTDVGHLNMEGIAEQCGFSNRVSFTKSFQKFTGVSPSFFMKNVKR